MTARLDKTKSLLSFLGHLATLRKHRIPEYTENDKVLWISDLPRGLPETWRDTCRSAFFSDNPADVPDLWLEVRKKRKPAFPLLPKELQDWVPQQFQMHPDEYIDREPDKLLDFLNPQITVVVEKGVADPGPLPQEASVERVPEVRHLEDYPEVEDAWLEYLESRWKPWAQEMRWWRQVQDVYERVDFMRRRLEEAEERYELVLAVGLLQWRDSTGATVKRHLLTAPAEISLDAARGVLTVRPAVSFEKFRVELDMLELQDRPRLEGTDIEDRLEELDVRAWDKASVAGILRIIANKASSDAQVSEDAWSALERPDGTFRVVYAPALVLRERRPTAYEELISRFLKAVEHERAFTTTAPWEHFVSEGETSGDVGRGAGSSDGDLDDAGGRLYFPLPTNDEQRQIAERLRRRPYVLVKGPPGTGKSHTIANLICHLLAMGQRVLVTAHAPKALAVLRDLLPGDIRNLCVTAIGSSREDHRLLEESVRGILSRRNEWKGEEWVQQEIERLAKELCELEGKSAIVDRQLRECREAETHSHTLPGGYCGTAAQIARQIENERDTYGWFPELAEDERRCPLQPEEVAFLADTHAWLTQERLDELRLEIGSFDLPDPSTFGVEVEKLSSASNDAKAALAGLREEELAELRPFDDAQLDVCRTFLQELEEQVTRASRVLGSLTDDLLKDLLVGRTARWERLEREGADLVESIQLAHRRVGTARVDIASEIEDEKLLADARRRLEYFKRGGRRGCGFLAARVIRETRYVEERCRVNGQAPREQEALDILVGFLELRKLLGQFGALWPTALDRRPSQIAHAAHEAGELVKQLSELLQFFGACQQAGLNILPIHVRDSLSERHERQRWRRLIEAELARRFADSCRARLESWLRTIRGADSDSQHPCMKELARSIEDRDVVRWRRAWDQRERLRRNKECVQRCEALLGKIQAACPELATLVRSTKGEPNWSERFRRLEQAWNWAAARAWLRRVADPEHYAQLTAKRRQLEKRMEDTVERLAVHKAWQAFFQRLDDQTAQSLKAWSKAVERIGKGTGKFAYKHRRTARQYLMTCIPKMPAWIMPLHRLWETVEPVPGVFDTVIVDEASQAGGEALLLLLLAKRIIVVGDDKQNSPEAVGVLEDDIARLARDDLRQFRFRDEFRPDTSLYDHAERAFGNVISLREHFRCVPEIIRFSNELCYREALLIPLRQPPPNRLPPLRVHFVNGAACEGSGQRIINRAEADAIVKTICECIADPAYEGKSMGVIVLQGHTQAELIERRLAEVLEPRVREERKLRCGVPATFQGDERDVIFLSLVVASNYGFRALTELEAQRRFNVAMSRARDQVWLFHSVQPGDLSKEDLRWRLLNFFCSPGQLELEGLYEEVDRLERQANRLSRERGQQPDPYESWFEVDVALELLRRRYRVRPQVEVAGYRIDLVVQGLGNRLAVECDGEAWHGPERFEQDMARQRQLERAGWTFVRIRESEFYAHREGAIRRIVEACEELDIRPIGDEERQEDKELELADAVTEVLLEKHIDEKQQRESD